MKWRLRLIRLLTVVGAVVVFANAEQLGGWEVVLNLAMLAATFAITFDWIWNKVRR